MLKSNKGVTLVALVITIIVLLILAGVSISLVVGDNGVLSNATDAVDDTNMATAKEEVEIALSSLQADFYSKYVDDTGLSFSDYVLEAEEEDDDDEPSFADYLENSGRGVTCDDSLAFSSGTVTVTVEYKGTEYSATIETNSADTGAVVKNFE